MDIKEFTKVVMNPVRQRIVQYLLIHGKGTAGEIQSELSDIPTASLYRHIKKLYDTGCIEVIEENKRRGTVEKTYGIVANPLSKEPNHQEMASLICSGLLTLQTSFLQYFEKPEVDPVKDMLLFQTSTLMLTDEEYMELLQKLGTIFMEAMKNGTMEGRKQRRITLISSPSEES